MRRILALLAVAIFAWIVMRRESTSTIGSVSATGTSAVQRAPSPAASSGSESSAGAAPEADRSTSKRKRAAQTSPANSGKGFRTRAQLDEHFAKHGSEFAGLSETQYLAMAQALRDAPVGGDILEIVRASDGVVSRFDKRSGAFLAFDRDGTIRTFFKPNDGEKYFRRQANRAPTS
ncbi:MAG: hypothetical protein ABI120_13700 [Gemmatimonadaceae bacterium]